MTAGTYQDFQKDVFKTNIFLDPQQMGSRLKATVTVESMDGNKTFFHRVGKVAHTVKTTRNQARVYQDQQFQKRQVQQTAVEYATLFDRVDMFKHVANPMGSFTSSAIAELGRQEDEIIYDAIGGNAEVTENGSTTSTALTLSIAVDDHKFDPAGGSGDVALTEYKLRNAIALLQTNYGKQGSERVFCIGPTNQLFNVSTADQTVSSDFRVKKPLEGPGMIEGLSGYLGIDFVAYDEETDTDGSSDEICYVYTQSAVHMGIYIPLTVDVHKDTTRALSPDGLAVFQSVGATRMFEEKVVKVLCDPI